MSLPLLGHAAPEAPLFWVSGAPVTRARFLADAARLAGRLPQDARLMNLCESRYAFAVALGATLLRRGTCLLPPSTAPAVIAEIARDGGAAGALTDKAALAGALPCFMVAAVPGEAATQATLPDIPAEHIAVVPYTSGSTGAPQPHPKHWGTLVRTAQLAADRFLAGMRAVHIVGTVPPQHMYGLETTVMLALAGDASAHSGRPLFPADLAQALAELPAPRLLITTPVHLRACVAAGTRFPEVARIISATAPLSAELAAQAEALFGCEVHEIYGCTEAGSMGSRHTRVDPTWRLYPGMRIAPVGEGARVEAEHLPETIAINDRVDIVAPDAFRLLGRATDLLKVAGKRISLADLTQRLLSIPGVEDGVVFAPEGDGPLQRPAALVVAPGLTEAQVLSALAQRVDPVFLPRPLKRVERLPRNEVGKLPRARLLELLGTPAQASHG